MILDILDKLRADSLHLIHLSQNEEKVQHAGLRGRLRELLIDNILTPWLPPYVLSGTGTIIGSENLRRESTQDDIILFDKTLNYYKAFNLFFAFKSDGDPENKNENFELKRLVEVMKELKIDPLSGIVPMICIVGKGFWKIGSKLNQETRTWQRLDSNDARDHISWFVACVSNSCFNAHMQRQGRDASKSLESGIGMYLDHPFTDIDISSL